MKKNLFYTVLVGFLIITLPCFARDFNFAAYEEHTQRIQLLKGYAEDYPALLLTPVSMDLVAYDAWFSAWHITFQQEPFDMAQFASAFDPEVRDKILDLILDEIEKRGSSDDLVDHPLVMPVWVSGNLEVNFSQWVQDRQTSSQQIAISVVEGASSNFKTGNMYDSTPGLHCPDYSYSNIPPSAWSKIKQYDKAQFPPDSPPQSSIVKAGDDRLPPNPFPYPPFPPRLYIVKAGDDKLPPNPFPYPPFPPRLYIVKAGDDKLPPNPFPYPPFPPKLSMAKAGSGSQLYQYQNPWSDPFLWKGSDNLGLNDHSYYSYPNPKLYFVVWPIVTPDQRGFSKELLDEFQFKKAEARVLTTVTATTTSATIANGIIDGYGEAGCEQGNIVEVAFTHTFSANPR